MMRAIDSSSCTRAWWPNQTTKCRAKTRSRLSRRRWSASDCAKTPSTRSSKRPLRAARRLKCCCKMARPTPRLARPCWPKSLQSSKTNLPSCKRRSNRSRMSKPESKACTASKASPKRREIRFCNRKSQRSSSALVERAAHPATAERSVARGEHADQGAPGVEQGRRGEEGALGALRDSDQGHPRADRLRSVTSCKKHARRAGATSRRTKRRSKRPSSSLTASSSSSTQPYDHTKHILVLQEAQSLALIKVESIDTKLQRADQGTKILPPEHAFHKGMNLNLERCSSPPPRYISKVSK